MANEQQTQRGTCPTHGEVEATRELPRPSFPFMLYAIRRLLAQRRPYCCPQCGSHVASA
jgi:hypothetical protein